MVYSYCGQSGGAGNLVCFFFSSIIILHQCWLYGAGGYPQEITVLFLLYLKLKTLIRQMLSSVFHIICVAVRET
jgi:hypothetical protein